jgi:phage terminase large subunit-like protein
MDEELLRALTDRMAARPREEWAELLYQLSEEERRRLDEHWPLWAHDGQLPGHDDWTVWLIRAGRGFGKTRAGAEWVSAVARARPEARIALVGATMDEVRAVMVEGASGLIALCRHGERHEWRSGTGEFTFDSGARAFVHSAEAPEKLRGPEHDLAWCDELAKWRHAEATWDNLMLGLRIGERPQAVVTTTPRPTRLLRRIMAMPGTIETRGATRDNLHLSDRVQATFHDQYAGTRLGRQELEGELVADVADAFWTRDLLDLHRVVAPPPLMRVVIGVDPPAGTKGDACGIVAIGRCAEGISYVLADASVRGATPEGWARAVAACAATYGADRVVAESNQGGAMVESVLRAAWPDMPVTLKVATASKSARAEPVSAQYPSGRIRHCGQWPELEDELCGLSPAGYDGPGRSPDRADALVWAATALMEPPRAVASVRGI